MQKEYTLISSVGKGMYKGEKYRTTRYQFPDGKEIEEKVFLLALLKKQYKPIKKIILVGTRTSSWDVLVEQTENVELWAKILEETKSEITDETILELQVFLTKQFQMPVVLKVHTPIVDENTIDDIFSLYNTIANDVAPDSPVLFDITHSFRSMPVLIYQTLQFNHAFGATAVNKQSIELVYGEYIEEEKISYVRNLSKYWELSEITVAKNLFEQKLDSSLLVEKIKPYWESGAKALEKLSNIVECNYALQVEDTLRQLKNALKNIDVLEFPDWVKDTFTISKNIYDTLYVEESETFKIAKILCKYSNLLEEKGLVTEAVITLQIATEVAVTEQIASSNRFGDYEWFQSHGKDEYKAIKKKLPKQHRESLWKIEELRNGIAHGGSKTQEGTFPHVASIPAILKKGKEAFKILIKHLEET